MVNAQSFAAAGAPVWSLGWCAAWLLDPMVSVVLVAVLRAEQVTAHYHEYLAILDRAVSGGSCVALGAAGAGVLRRRNRTGAAGSAHRSGYPCRWDRSGGGAQEKEQTPART